MGKEAKFTESISFLATKETGVRLEIIAAQQKMGKSDLLRRIVDSYVADHIEEAPSRQVITANIKYTLKEMEKKLLARADEADAKAVAREAGLFKRWDVVLGGLGETLKDIHQALLILPEMKATLDEFLSLWYEIGGNARDK
jgi:hypothetical protein